MLDRLNFVRDFESLSAAKLPCNVGGSQVPQTLRQRKRQADLVRRWPTTHVLRHGFTRRHQPLTSLSLPPPLPCHTLGFRLQPAASSPTQHPIPTRRSHQPTHMLPYTSIPEAESALGRSLTPLETLWLRYSAAVPDYVLYCHSILLLFLVFTLAPLPLTFLELRCPRLLTRYKLQPKSPVPPASSFLRCYRDVARVFFLVVGPLQLASYPTIKWIGIRSGLPLPSWRESAAQLLVYFLVEDFGNYWIHRWMHCRWGYDHIHRVHHEYTAPFGFAATYAHWAEVLVLGIPSFAGPAMVPCHMLTFWAWIVLRQLEAIETHTGYDFPLNPTKLIPFYGGAEHHDYHHYVGGQSQSNFASVFTYCDFLYGTDKGYRYHKTQLAKIREQRRLFEQREPAGKPVQKFE